MAGWPRAATRRCLVIDDGQNTEPPAIGKCIRQKIQAPALIGALGKRHRCSAAQSTLATAAPTYLQPFLAIEATELLVVHDDALAREQDMEASIAEPTANRCEIA